MGAGAFLLILALVVLVGLIVSRPLLEGGHPKLTKEKSRSADHERSTLLAERDQVLRSLKELDFDYALGKIPEEDYQPQRKILVQKGAGVLKKLDQFQPVHNTLEADPHQKAITPSDRGKFSDLPHLSDGNGRRSASQAAGAAVAAPDDELEVLLANRRRDRRDKATGFCPKCGAPHQRSDQFCPKCGAKVVSHRK